ncbi:sigma-70 family RNA polymerase sigma factor [Chitinophagales bacterium]|jgi:RNA polymerase sigma factor (sigma-70 family)|nr:sigma-70 family RNA polymerase sigma factor [Chitinophagales bacterium]
MMLAKNFYNEVKPYELLLKSVAFNLTKSSADAEDLLQDTYFKACKSLSKYQEGTNLKAWLITIMKNTFINNYRKRKKEQETITKPGDIHDGMLHHGALEIEPGVRILLSETLKMAIESLKPEMRDTFMMYFEGYKYHEIADQLDLPLGTVKSRIFLARKDLISFLQKNGIHHSSLAS